MAKKKEIAETNETKKMTREQYLLWALKIEELQHAKTKLSAVEQKWSVLEKQCEIERLKSALFKSTIEQSKSGVSLAEKAYQDVKLELENQLGMSLSGTSIDDVTLEINKL
jgi:hypothetical protein